MGGADIGAIQKPMGVKDIDANIVYTYVLHYDPNGVVISASFVSLFAVWKGSA
jgi:hypothetical protein